MPTKTFTDAVTLARYTFDALTQCKLRFAFYLLPDKNQMRFTAVEDADTIKKILPSFEIKNDERQRRYVELVINYE